MKLLWWRDQEVAQPVSDPVVTTMKAAAVNLAALSPVPAAPVHMTVVVTLENTSGLTATTTTSFLVVTPVVLTSVQPAIARVRVTGRLMLSGKSRIQSKLTATHPAVTRIQTKPSALHTAIAKIQLKPKATQTAKAKVQIKASTTQTALAKIRRPQFTVGKSKVGGGDLV